MRSHPKKGQLLKPDAAPCGDSSFEGLSQKNLFHSLSVVLLYLLSIPCLYIPSLYPFFTQSLPVTHTLLTLPIYVHTLHSLSILLIYPPLYHPTLQPPDSPYFKIPSLHSHSLLPLYTPLISSSLLSVSTPFSTISTAQSPLGSPLVTRQPILYEYPL